MNTSTAAATVSARTPDVSTHADEQADKSSSSVSSMKRPRWRSGRAEEPFRLTDSFLSKYANKQPPFGFNGLGEVVYLRTYSRQKEDGEKEAWYVTHGNVRVIFYFEYLLFPSSLSGTKLSLV
jgi:hypothetical protein